MDLKPDPKCVDCGGTGMCRIRRNCKAEVIPCPGCVAPQIAQRMVEAVEAART